MTVTTDHVKYTYIVVIYMKLNFKVADGLCVHKNYFSCYNYNYVVNGVDHVVHCKGISLELNSLCDHELSHKR